MLRVAARKVRTALSLLRWRAFRRQYQGHVPVIAPPDPTLPVTPNQEQYIGDILRQPGVQSFLEVGIGPNPNIDRMRAIAERKLRYTGCDFEEVCDSHRRQLQEAGVDLTNITFLSNRTGTYTWNLMELVGKRETFDAVYLDGHHTLYVDLPAAVLLDRLLRPGGYYMVDDVCWTLSFLIGKMMAEYGTWNFYHSMYDLSEYTPEQMVQPHIGMIARDVLIGQHGYTRIDRFSTGYWWCLAKPGDSGGHGFPASHTQERDQ